MRTPLPAIAAIALAGCATATSQAATSATRTTTVAAVTGSVTGPTRIIVEGPVFDQLAVADPDHVQATVLEWGTGGRLSLPRFIGHLAYGPDVLRADLDRFTLLLGKEPP